MNKWKPRALALDNLPKTHPDDKNQNMRKKLQKTKSRPKQREQSKSQIKIGAALGPGFPAPRACLNCLPNLVFFFYFIFIFMFGSNVLQLTFFTYTFIYVLFKRNNFSSAWEGFSGHETLMKYAIWGICWRIWKARSGNGLTRLWFIWSDFYGNYSV